jgi:hypothetical protein
MKNAKLTVEGKRYSVSKNNDLTYSVVDHNGKILIIAQKLGAYLTYKWATIDGKESAHIEKIGFKIETYNLNSLLANTNKREYSSMSQA